MLVIDQNIICCPALYFYRHPPLIMLIAFQYFDNVQQPRNIFSYPGCCECTKRTNIKHQCDENRNAERTVQNASHLRRTEGLRQPLQRRGR